MKLIHCLILFVDMRQGIKGCTDFVLYICQIVCKIGNYVEDSFRGGHTELGAFALFMSLAFCPALVSHIQEWFGCESCGVL